MKQLNQLNDYIEEEGEHLTKIQNKNAINNLIQLYNVVFNQKHIHYFLEKSDNIDKVLNIFIRLNTGGTKLGYSDLLFSMVVVQWDGFDARKIFTALQKRLNARGNFRFDTDFILKAGLMLINNSSVNCKVSDFNTQTTKRLQENWERISQALILTIDLI